jgi:hypothetical protein
MAADQSGDLAELPELGAGHEVVHGDAAETDDAVADFAACRRSAELCEGGRGKDCGGRDGSSEASKISSGDVHGLLLEVGTK